jgi:hypothetical protein
MHRRMHKRTEQKEDGRLIHYYTFTPVDSDTLPKGDSDVSITQSKSFEAFDGEDEDHRAAHFDGNWGG